jgi:hypothetical protein
MESKVKTGVVRSITANGDWQYEGKTIYKWEVVLDDGIPGSLNSQKVDDGGKPIPPVKVGDEIKVEVKETTSATGTTYTNYKLVRENNRPGGGGGQRFQPNPERDAQIARMNCVTNAMALVNAGAIKPEDALHIADQLYAYIQTGQNKPLLLNL